MSEWLDVFNEIAISASSVLENAPREETRRVLVSHLLVRDAFQDKRASLRVSRDAVTSPVECRETIPGCAVPGRRRRT